MSMKHLEPIITEAIKRMTAPFKLNLLGPGKIDSELARYLIFSYRDFDPNTTLEAAYLHGNSIHGGTSDSIDKTTINQLQNNAQNYIDSLEQKAIADASRAVSDLMHEKNQQIKQIVDPVERAQKMKALIKETKKLLREQRKRIVSAANTIVEHELNQAQSYGAFDGILSVTRKMGIDDPTVFKIPVKDKDLCFEQNTLIHTVNGLKPAKDLIVGDVLRSHKNISGHQDRSLKLNSVVQYINNTPKECIEVEMEDGTFLTCTQDHPVLIKYKNRYMFWEIGNIPESMWSEIDIVNATTLSIKEKKRMTAHVSLPSIKKLGYEDIWHFIKFERVDIIQRYLSKETLLSISNSFHPQCEGLRTIISLILKLSGVFSTTLRQNANNNYNQKYTQEISLGIQQKLKNNHQFIKESAMSGIPYRSISNTLDISTPLMRKYIKSILSSSDLKEITKEKRKKANAALQERKRIDPELCARLKEVGRQRMLKISLKGSNPQQQLANLLASNGHKVEYEKPVFNKIRVDMIIDGGLVIEFDGSGHDMRVRMNQITKNQLSQKDYARDQLCLQNGFKVLRIVSNKDIVPPYETLNKHITELLNSELQFRKITI